MKTSSTFISHTATATTISTTHLIKPRRGFLQICADWQLITALSITTLILALNVSLPNLSNPNTQSLSTYQTRLPTIQYRNPIPKFIYLSYLNPLNGFYFKGNDDIYFVGFWVLVWLSLREVSMKLIWRPVGIAAGLSTRTGRLQRFAEQGWNLVYYTVFWSMGVKILSGYPRPIYSLDIRQYWLGYPHDSLPALTKFYYLSQTAFWFQQMIVLNLEKHRKDHYQMLAHHIVTATLVCASYATNFTGLGLIIHTTMDLSDILLSLAKMLNYLGGGWACDGTFSLFVISWIVTRHIVFGKIIYAIYADLPVDIPYCWDPAQGRMVTRPLWIGFLVLLGFLQVLLLFWLWLILRIMWGVLLGNGADDERSETDESETEEGVQKWRDEKKMIGLADTNSSASTKAYTDEVPIDGDDDPERVRLVLNTPAMEEALTIDGDDYLDDHHRHQARDQQSLLDNTHGRFLSPLENHDGSQRDEAISSSDGFTRSRVNPRK